MQVRPKPPTLTAPSEEFREALRTALRSLSLTELGLAIGSELRTAGELKGRGAQADYETAALLVEAKLHRLATQTKK